MKPIYYLVILIFFIFFAISFLTNILGSINPNVSDSFTLNGTMTGLLPFSFFIAYALMSIPSGMIVQKYDEKKSLVFAWILAFFGALLFSLLPVFPVFLVFTVSYRMRYGPLAGCIIPFAQSYRRRRTFCI